MNKLLLLFSALFLFIDHNSAQNKKADELNAKKECPKGCDAGACPQMTQVCPAGVVKDICDCCSVCGKKEGEACDVDVINDERQYFQRPLYTPVKGRCGESLKCVWQKDDQPNSVDDSASCVCIDQKPVCGEDGKTYKNKCTFMETMTGRREKFRIVRDEPCDEAPTILSAPQPLEESVGGDVILSCEVVGYPPPKIEWIFTRGDGVIVSMPNDDVRKSVQARGGPGHYQATAWLQLQALEVEDSGVYTCIGRNKLGKASADATLTVIPKNGEL